MILNIFSIFQVNEILLRPTSILWILLIILLFLSGGLFLIKAITLDMKSQKMIYFGLSIFLYCFGITRSLFFISWTCLNVFEGCSEFYMILGFITGILGLICWIFVLETYLVKTKKVFSILTIASFVISLIALFGLTDRPTALNIIYILLPGVVLTIIILYIYLIIKSTGIVRKKAIGLLIGIIVFVIGHMMDYSKSPLSFGVTEIISPLLSIVGIVIFTTTQLFIK